MSRVTNGKLTSFMIDWESNNETAYLRWAPRSVDMRLKSPARSAVDVKLVELGSNAADVPVLADLQLREEQLGDNVDDAASVGAE